ncbi:hypothetical protein [Vibrio crassostreae]|uniref:hypothetical protein n=1 Tax=Vibrio crassostreae TaxID=246167 RepID=UPI001B3186F4|nr:hypothetical protein [Vibrio crassostreae]
MKPKSIVLYLKPNGLSSVDQRQDVAAKIRAKGYTVDDFSTVICVNGIQKEGEEFPVMLTCDQANEVLEEFQKDAYDPKEPSAQKPRVRIDVVHLIEED